MLPSNVVSFMKKMVTTEGTGAVAESGDTTLSKIRGALSSGLMNAQDRVTNKLSHGNKQPDVPPEPPKPEEPPPPKPVAEAGKPISRSGTCRVCLKAFKPEDFSKTCGECQQKVCEDCASYSKPEDAQDDVAWRCSICRRRAASRAVVVGQDSTDSLLDAPVLEALQRRHSDVKIGSGGLSAGGPTSGLAPPRSPELRRHSDVSPASLKELEKAVLKVQSERARKQGRSAAGSPSTSRATSPSVERRPFPSEEPPSGQATQEHLGDNQDEAWRRAQASRGRRKSRVTKQHSYDDEMKAAGAPGGTSLGPDTTGLVAAVSSPVLLDPRYYRTGLYPNCGLGLPASLPRRASAYDVYAPRGEPVSSAGLVTGPQSSGGTQGGPRRASFRAVPPSDSDETQGIPVGGTRRGSFRAPPSDADDSSGNPVSGTRRASFRAVPAPDPDDTSGSSPMSTPDTTPSLLVDDDRRSRRRGSQLPDISGLRSGPRPPPVISRAPEDAMRRQTSVQDGEAIKIVIHDVDCDASYGPRTTSKRRVNLRRDPNDKAHRTRGFGMRVVGGKSGADGRLFAYIVWTVPSGAAEKGGLQQGDKVLEWNGISLVDKTFEEVSSIMDRTGDGVEILVEHGNDLRMCDLLDEPIPAQSRKNSGEALALGLETETDKSPASPTRRKLPKTPEQLAKEKEQRVLERPPVSGRVQLQVYYNDDNNSLVVSVFAADDLAPRDDPTYGVLPEAYLQLRLLPFTGDCTAVKTDVAEPTQAPMWNTTLELKNVNGSQLMETTVEVTLWDYKPDKEQVFLGECTVDLQKALLDDNPIWYRLEDPRQLRTGGSRSARSSIASDASGRTLRKGDRSLSGSIQQCPAARRCSVQYYDGNCKFCRNILTRIKSKKGRQVDEPIKTSDVDAEACMFLHPDYAYGASSRRGSSQSEQIEYEPYELPKDLSRSLPGSRRSSFQSGKEDGGDAPAEPPPPSYNAKGRRRSSICRGAQDPEEVLKSLKALKEGKAEGTPAFPKERRRSSICRAMRDPDEILRSLKLVSSSLGRAASIKDKRRPSRSGSIMGGELRRKESSSELLMEPSVNQSSPSEEEDTWSTKSEVKQLGPGQVQPRGYQLRIGMHVEIKLSLLMTKGQLEVEVIQARGIRGEPPDTYVKTYLRDGDRWLQKRKTRVIRRCNEPQFRQTLRYAACDIECRSLVVMLWERQKGFEHNTGLGGAEVALANLPLTQLTISWYPLFPIHTLGSDSNDSP